MTPEARDLWFKIDAFDIDGRECDLSFVARLCREQGWSRSYAERVVREYKRYVFLAVSSDAPQCPSEDVDAAWHLHLTYTHSYWDRFCGQVLGRPLHHEPTRGGPGESAKHFTIYGVTLAAYRETFGEEPPADIWPSPDVRFGDDIRHRQVNVARNWVIPKRAVKRAVQIAAGVLFVADILPGCEGGVDPFSLKGVEFLYVLIPAMIGAMILGRVLRTRGQGAEPQSGDEDVRLTWEQAALLAGGPARLTAAAIARLAQDGIVRSAGDGLESSGSVQKNRSVVEGVIISHLPLRKDQLKSLQKNVDECFQPEKAKLERDGLANSATQRLRSGLISLTPVAAVFLLLGLPRLLMGIAANRPVAYLVITLIIGMIVSLFVCLWSLDFAAPRGKRLLDRLRMQNQNCNSDLGLAVALFGPAVLAGTSVAYAREWCSRPHTGGMEGGCHSGCGSGCGGGCGSGCGGCGGD